MCRAPWPHTQPLGAGTSTGLLAGGPPLTQDCVCLFRETRCVQEESGLELFLSAAPSPGPHGAVAGEHFGGGVIYNPLVILTGTDTLVFHLPSGALPQSREAFYLKL